MLELVRTDPDSPEAVALIAALTAELSGRYDFPACGAGHFRPEDVRVAGAAFVVGRLTGRAVACGAFRPLETGICEIKRMFVEPEFRGRGFSRIVLAELERLAVRDGYSTARLETGDRQPEAIALYERVGYCRISGFGPYADRARSVCFERRLTPQEDRLPGE